MFTVNRNCILIKNLQAISRLNIMESCLQHKFKRNMVLKWTNVLTKSYSSGTEKLICESITQGDKEMDHKLKVIELEAEVMRQDGKAVPSNDFFKEEHWQELLNLPTRTARRKYFEYLFKISKKKENRQAKKVEKRLKREEFLDSQGISEETTDCEEEFALKYDLKHNNIFLRIYDSTINQMYNNRLIQAMMFGQKLVVDCGYDEHMTKRENLNCAKQLMLLFAENRAHNDPFDLHYCNSNPQGILMTQLQKYIPTMYETSFPLNIHQCSYLDVFPKDQLVYLTPHCREEMTEFDHDAVYIIGGIVDKMNNEPLSLAKAKKEGIKMSKFPLDKYLQWGAGSGKSLTLNQVASILNDIKTLGNWEYALRHVPKRKLDFNGSTPIDKVANNSQFYEHRKERKWAPSTNIDLKNDGYNSNIKNRDKARIIKIKSIMSDD